MRITIVDMILIYLTPLYCHTYTYYDPYNEKGKRDLSCSNKFQYEYRIYCLSISNQDFE